jgi:mycofactocin precursor
MAGSTNGGTVSEELLPDAPIEPATGDATEVGADHATDLLVEEVSIDGLCGVY